MSVVPFPESCSSTEQSEYSDQSPASEVLLVLRRLWVIATILQLGLTEEKTLSIRSVCFHLIQAVSEANKNQTESELDRLTRIFGILQGYLGSSVPSIDAESSVQLPERCLAEELLDRIRPSTCEIPREENDPAPAQPTVVPNPEEVKELILWAVRCVDLLMLNERTKPLSGAISVAAGTYQLYPKIPEESLDLEEQIMARVGDLGLEIVKSRAQCDLHLGQACEAIEYLFQLGGDWSIQTTAKMIRAVGLDAMGYGNRHTKLISRAFQTLNGFSRAHLGQSNNVGEMRLRKEQLVSLITALYEGCTYLRSREELLPTLQLVLNSQSLLSEIILDGPNSFGGLTSNGDSQIDGFDSFLARAFGVLSWTAEFNPADRMRALSPLSPEPQNEGTNPLWDLISIETYSVLLEAVLGDRLVESQEQWTESHNNKYLVGVALNSLFRVFRHRSIVQKLSTDNGCSGSQDISRWLCNGVALLHQHLNFEDQDLSTAHAWKLASGVAQLKLVFGNVSDLTGDQSGLFFTINDDQRSDCLEKLIELGERLNNSAMVCFQESRSQFLREADALINAGKLHPIKRSAELLCWKYLMLTPNPEHRLAAWAVLRLVSTYDREPWDPSTKLPRPSFDATRAIRRQQRTTSHCAAYLMALVRSGDNLSALKWFEVLVVLTRQPAAFEEYLPVWHSFFNEQRIPAQRDILHSIVILESWLASVLTSEQSDMKEKVIATLEAWGISAEKASSVNNQCLMGLLPQDLRAAMARTLQNELFPELRVQRMTQRRDPHRLNSFEAGVNPHIRSFFQSLKNDPNCPVEDFEIRSNSFFFMYEVDFLVIARFQDGSEKVVIVRCNGEAWHRIFGGILSDTDRVKNQVLINAAKYIDMTPEIRVVEVRQAEFQTRIQQPDQKAFIHSLLASALAN